MGVNEFESFEQQFLELIGEFQSLSLSEIRLQDSLRVESSRAETAEAARASAVRAASEARAGAAAATAGATQAAAALARAQDEFTTVKMQKDLADRQRSLLEVRCSELSMQLGKTERELQQLRPLQASYTNLHRQYQEMYERINTATEVARAEASRLENELRRVEKCASGGTEVRERARLAAAAHARERRLAAAELQHTLKELFGANAEIARLHVSITNLQRQLSEFNSGKTSNTLIVSSTDAEALIEARAALEAERAGSAKLERALAVALKDNASLAVKIHAEDNATVCAPATVPQESRKEERSTTNLSALDSFLAD